MNAVARLWHRERMYLVAVLRHRQGMDAVALLRHRQRMYPVVVLRHGQGAHALSCRAPSQGGNRILPRRRRGGRKFDVAGVARPQRAHAFLAGNPRQAFVCLRIAVAAVNDDVCGAPLDVIRCAGPGDNRPWRGAPLCEEGLLSFLRTYGLDHLDRVPKLALHPIDDSLQPVTELGRQGREIAPHGHRIAARNGGERRRRDFKTAGNETRRSGRSIFARAPAIRDGLIGRRQRHQDRWMLPVVGIQTRRSAERRTNECGARVGGQEDTGIVGLLGRCVAHLALACGAFRADERQGGGVRRRSPTARTPDGRCDIARCLTGTLSDRGVEGGAKLGPRGGVTVARRATRTRECVCHSA